MGCWNFCGNDLFSQWGRIETNQLLSDVEMHIDS